MWASFSSVEAAVVIASMAIDRLWRGIYRKNADLGALVVAQEVTN
jgi:hypothetical protein